MEAFLANARIGVPLDKKILENIRNEQIVRDFFKNSRNKYENPYTAIAELADNAHDSDAKNFSIDYYNGKNERLEFLDDGKGMSLDEALSVITHYPRTRKPAGKIGRYGHALVCATASIGKVFMVFTKQTKEVDGVRKISYTVLMVSHQFHSDYDLTDTIYAPCLSYDDKFELIETEDVDTQNLNRHIIEQYGPVPMTEVKSMLQKITSPNGTLIVIGKLEEDLLNFWNDPSDILQDQNETHSQRDKSLREFLKPLYLDARMKVRLRGVDIYPKKVCECFAAKFEVDILFCKTWGEPGEVVSVRCGLEVENRENDGVHFYINGRLVLFGYKNMKFFKERNKTSVGFTAYVNLNGEKFEPAVKKTGFAIEVDFQKLVGRVDKAMEKYYEYIITYWISYKYFNQEYKDIDGEDLIEPFWNDIGYPNAFDRNCPREPLSTKAKEWNLKECGVWIVCYKCRQWKRDHLELDPNFKKEKMYCAQLHHGRRGCKSRVSDHERFDVTLREWQIQQKMLEIKKEGDTEEEEKLEAEEEPEEEEAEEEDDDVIVIEDPEEGEKAEDELEVLEDPEEEVVYDWKNIPEDERGCVTEDEEEEMEEEPEEEDDEEIMELTREARRAEQRRDRYVDDDELENVRKRRRDLEDLDDRFPYYC